MLAVKYLGDERTKQRKAKRRRPSPSPPTDVTGKRKMNKNQTPGDPDQAAGQRPAPNHRTQFHLTVRATYSGAAVGAGHRCERQQSDSEALSGRQYAGGDAGAWR